MYEIEFTAHAKRQFLKLIPDVQTRLQIAIDNLADDPYSPNPNRLYLMAELHSSHSHVENKKFNSCCSIVIIDSS